jgi:translocation and assembly module TamB
VRRASGILLAILLVVLAAGAGGLWWLAESPAALRWAADRVESAFDGRLRIAGLSGSLIRGFTADHAIYSGESTLVRLDGLQIDWSLRALLSRSIHVSSLSVKTAEVSVTPGDSRGNWPPSLALPIELRIDRARINEFTFRMGDYAPIAIAEITLSYAGGAKSHVIEALRIDLPWGRFSGKLSMGTQHVVDNGFPGMIAIRNEHPGPWSAGRIPLAAAAANLTLAERMLTFSGVSADLGAAGQAHGQAQLAGGRTTISLDVSNLDLKSLHESLTATALTGRVDGELDGAAQRIVAQLTGHDLALTIDATRRASTIEVTQLAVRQHAASLEGHGRIDLDGARQFTADLRFNGIDPSVIIDMPRANLHGTAQLAGGLSPALNVSGRFSLQRSTFREIPLSAHGVFSADRRRVTTQSTLRHPGGSTLRLDGAVGRRSDSLHFDLKIPAAEALDPRFTGRLVANGTISGAIAQPRVRMNFSGESVALGGLRAEAFSGSLSGTQDEHVATLRAEGESFEAELLFGGSLLGNRWSGTIESFENRGRYPIRLSAPAQLAVSPGELTIGATGLDGLDGSIRIGHLDYREGKLHTTGEFSGVRTSGLLVLAGLDAGDMSLRIGGSWRIAATPRLNGEFRIAREAGDIVFAGAQAVPIQLRELLVEGTIREDHLRVTGRLKSERLAQAHFTFAALPLAGARSPALGLDSPVQGRLELSLPSLHEFGQLTGLDARFGGVARLTLSAAGTLRNPSLTGAFEADQVRVSAPRHSVFLTDGRARIEFANREVHVTELSILGGAGKLVAAGRVPQRQTGAVPTLEWRAENFRLFSSPTRHLVLEGSGSLAMRDRQPVARGELRVTEALFAADTFDVPRLTQDVVIVGREPTSRRQRGDPLPIDVDVAFDFGDQFRIREAGLDARLAGRLRISSNAAGEPLAEGIVEILQGTYVVYGQTLNIENGRLFFDGPADNPRLDIMAMRRNLLVEAGVRITGTAQAPRVQLVSEPQVPEIDKLSWLVLGRPAGSGSRTDFAMLAAAAQALLAGPSGVPMTTRVARRIGVDHVGLQSLDGETDAVMLGRRISDRVYAVLQRGISTADSMLIIEYTLTRNLRLRAEAGDVTGFGIAWGRSLE